MGDFLKATNFVNSDAPSIMKCAKDTTNGKDSEKDKAIALYYFVRDEIRYDPYNISFCEDGLKASYTLKNGYGYCVAKAVLLAALLRASGIPARLGFADVKNHMTSEKLMNLMQTDIFVWHGYTEVLLGGNWIKVTPTFNKSLCEKSGIKTMEFDGVNDAIFHPFDADGNRHMEYVNDHGWFEELPFEQLTEAFRKTYPLFIQLLEEQSGVSIDGDFEEEVLLNS